MGVLGIDNEDTFRKRVVADPTCVKIWKTITAKTVASPYFTANDFAFAYAKA